MLSISPFKHANIRGECIPYIIRFHDLEIYVKVAVSRSCVRQVWFFKTSAKIEVGQQHAISAITVKYSFW